jgi:divalent metal cation (Fe/Co/Zn/Cd) transporter
LDSSSSSYVFFFLNSNNDKIYFSIVHIRNLTGYTAPTHFLQQLTWLAFHHSPLIRKIDAVRAYHFGTQFLVEIDVLLPSDLHLGEAVHVGIGLEQKIEALSEVERAFVHLNSEHITTNSNNISVDQNQQLITAVNRRQHKIV